MTFKQHFTFFIRSFFLQTGWNYMKFQNLGFLFVMWPFLKGLYKNDKDALPSVLSRYLATFNTQPVMASFCFGALAKQEELITGAKTLPQFNEEFSQWISIKRGLTITTASIGDRLFWGTLKPFTLLLALFMWITLGIKVFEIQPEQLQPPLAYTFMACIMAFIAFNAIALLVKWQGIKIGYATDERACFGLTKFDWNRTIYNAKRIGIVLAVAMILFGFYNYLKDARASDLQFITRATIVVFFVCISFITRRLRIHNLYLYLAAVLVFNIACFF